MNRILVLAAFLSLSAHANFENSLNQFINFQGPRMPEQCDQDELSNSIKPDIKKAEFKVSLPCGSEEKLPLGKKEEETISFYEKSNPAGKYPLNDQGLIVRSRVSKTDPGKKDVTLKFRPKGGELKVKQKEYEHLKMKTKEAQAVDKDNPALEMKCEADVTYVVDGHNKSADSCSITTTTDKLTEETAAFMSMVGSEISVLPGLNLDQFKKIDIQSTSWVLDQSVANGKISDAGSKFNFKKVNLERWMVNGTCILEASVKIDVAKVNETASALVKSFKALSIDPDHEEQGNKTKKAMESAPSGWTK